MSVDSARNKVTTAQKQIAQLQRAKSEIVQKVAGLTKRAAAAYQAAAKASSPSTATSKMREYQRCQDDIATAQKRVSEYEGRIAREHQRLADAQKELSREEGREQDRLTRVQERRARDVQMRIQGMSSKLSEHDLLHQDAMSAIERLSRLPERITVLFLASNPVDEPALRLDAEAREIADMIRRSAHRDAVRFETCWAVQPLDVLQAINEHNPRVVHFSGHGSDQGDIVFQDRHGNAKPVSADAIVQTMTASSEDLQLVFFNTCFSARQAEAVVKRVPAAVGMTVAVGDDAARVFAAQFYSAVGFGKSVRRAFEQAKAALMLEGIAEEDTPVLYAADGCDPDGLVLVRPPDAPVGV